MVVVKGSTFVAHLSFKEFGFEIDKQTRSFSRTVQPESVQSIITQPDGSTKLVLRLARDIVVPTKTKEESSNLTIQLNKILLDVRARTLNRKMAARRGKKGPILGPGHQDVIIKTSQGKV